MLKTWPASWAIEWAKYNINVNAIAPTFVEAPFSKPMFEKEGFREYVLENIPLQAVQKVREEDSSLTETYDEL